VKLAARLIEIFMPSSDADATRIGPFLDAVALDLGTDERVPFAPASLGNADIAV
jgi:hypothetical protein